MTGYYREDIYTPYQELSDRFKQVLLYGSGDEKIPFYTMRNGRPRRTPKPFEGIIPNSQRRYRQNDSSQAREEAKQYMQAEGYYFTSGLAEIEISRFMRE